MWKKYTVKQDGEKITFKDGRRFAASIEKASGIINRCGVDVPARYRTFIKISRSGGIGGAFAADEFGRAVDSVCESLAGISGGVEFHGIENIKAF